MAPIILDRRSETLVAEAAIGDAHKLAMRRLAASVAVLSARHEGRRYAMAATSVQSLSMSPPSIVACVNQSASMHIPLASGSSFCVNILSVSDVAIARACAGGLRGEDRFQVGDWRDREDGVPYLEGAQVNLFCEHDGHMAYGTHGMFVGRIREVRVKPEISPLLYANGSYRGLGDDLPSVGG